MTLNSGRFLINLKPQRRARPQRNRSHPAACSRRSPSVPGITLYMQPVQDLTDRRHGQPRAVSVRAGERQSGRIRDLGAAARRSACSRLPQLADVASDLQQQGLALDIVDRPRHRRPLRHHAGDVDNALYDAFGQRIISTIYTQSNQYRVILEGDPTLQRSLPSRSTRSICPRRRRRPTGRCRSRRSSMSSERPAPLLINHLGQFPATTISFNLAPGVSLGDAVDAIDSARSADSACRISFVTAFQGAAPAFQSSLSNELLLIIAAVVTDVHRARRALRELHPPDHDPLDAAVGGRRRAARADDCGRRPRRHRDHRHHSADRHRQEERDHDDRLRARRRAQRGHCRRARRSTRPACCASGRS